MATYAHPHNLTVQLPLQTGGHALLDLIDLATVRDYSWYLGACGHVFRVEERQGRTSRPVYLHRVILQPPAHLHVSHRNGDPLDCRRENLLLLTDQQKSARSQKRRGTSSQYRGVSWQKQIRRWTASIHVAGRQYHLGTFLDEREAARAYDRAALQAFGEHARPNFPDENAGRN